jgi:NAD(P)H-dependent FMN reductase
MAPGLELAAPLQEHDRDSQIARQRRPLFNLTVIVASTRPGRVGPTVAEWFTARARQQSAFEVHLVDLAEVDLPFLDEPEFPSLHRYAKPHTWKWSDTVSAADAFVFVMPEYNAGFTAPLKNALDFLYDEWGDKPVGFVSYSMSSGGLRAVQMIKPIINTLRMIPVTDAVSIRLRERLDDEGVLHPDEVMEGAATVMLNELERLTVACVHLRTPMKVALS